MIILSPGLAFPPDIDTPSGITPIPEVFMNILSAAPLCTTFVSPATIFTPHLAAVSPIAATISSSSLKGSPSSIIKPQLKYSGIAPLAAKSFTVPQIASFPILPPLKKTGLTTKESVVNATLPIGSPAIIFHLRNA
jgi:hypothetical protein